MRHMPIWSWVMAMQYGRVFRKIPFCFLGESVCGAEWQMHPLRSSFCQICISLQLSHFLKTRPYLWVDSCTAHGAMLYLLMYWEYC